MTEPPPGAASARRSSRARLDRGHRQLFPGETLFDRVGRALCEAECLPRKELHESWEVARRVRRHFRGGRVVDLACGHGLLASLLLLLDDSSPGAIGADRRLPPSAARVAAAMAAAWPRLHGRVRLVQGAASEIELRPGDLVVSVHACGSLTDAILEQAMEARARVALLPCCHEHRREPGALEGWLGGALAIDVERALRLASAGYRVRTQRIPSGITAKDRLLLGEPR